MPRLPIRILSVTLALAVLAAPLQSALAQPQTTNPHLDAALRLYSDFEYEKALEQLAKAAGVEGNSVAQNVTINLYSAVIKLELGDREGAVSDFETALRLDDAAELPVKVAPKVEELFERARAEIRKAREERQEAAAPLATTPSPAATERLMAGAEPVESPPTVVREASTGGVPVLPIALAGVGVALGGGGAWFGYSSRRSVEVARTTYFQSDAVDRLADARAQALTANVLYAAAGAAVIAGLIVLLVDGDEAPAVTPPDSP